MPLFCGMKQLLRKYLAIVSLVAYLLPFVAKGLHDYAHKPDFVCKAVTEHHYHAYEHTCALCDISLPISDRPVTVSFVAGQPVLLGCALLLPAAKTAVTPSPHYFLRGPPFTA